MVCTRAVKPTSRRKNARESRALRVNGDTCSARTQLSDAFFGVLTSRGIFDFFPVLFFRAYRVYRKPMRVASVHKEPGCSETGARRISITGLPYVRLPKGLEKTKKKKKKRETLSRPRRSSDHTGETWL